MAEALGTLSVQPDFLRPGRGDCFRTQTAIMRTGNKAAVTHMAFFNNQEILIAFGAGTHIVG